jgi:hypothetical protein
MAERPKVSVLARWRLKRAIDYFEAQIGKPVSLAAASSSAGLSPMHFAAQFRAATGLRPHEYLLRRRVARMHGGSFGVHRLRHCGFEVWREDPIVAGDHVPRRFGQPCRCGRRCPQRDCGDRTLSDCQGLLFRVREVLCRISGNWTPLISSEWDHLISG